MFSKSNKIFLTGATGFVGSYILRKLLLEGFTNIICLKRETSTSEMTEDTNSVQWVTGDILDVCFLDDITKGVDIIIHAAALVTFDPKSFKKMITTAMEGTANLVNVALDNRISKFIHISSVAAIGRKKQEDTISEKNIFSKSQYDTTYGLSKFLAEQEVWRGHAEGLNTTILNPSMVLGVGKWDDSSVQIFKRLYNGSYYYPTGMTGWVDVRDVAKVVCMCITEKFNGERYVISAENLTYKHVFETIAKHLDKKPPEKALSQRLSSILWRIEALRSWIMNKKPIITKETVKSMSVHSKYINEKSIQNFNIEYIPIEKTIEECCHIFLESIQKGEKHGILPH